LVVDKTVWKFNKTVFRDGFAADLAVFRQKIAHDVYKNSAFDKVVLIIKLN